MATTLDDWPLLRWRMREYRHGRWGTEIVRKNAKLADDIVDDIDDDVDVDIDVDIAVHVDVRLRGHRR